jgi:hypothetical protein
MRSIAVAVAGLLVVAVIASIVFVQDPNNPSYGYVPKSLESNTSSTNPSTELMLRLSLNATTIKSGQTLNITASEYNTLPTMDNISAASDWPRNGLSVSPCGTLNSPFGMAIFRGYLTGLNVSSAKPLDLYEPYGVVMCPAILSQISAYSYYPHSSIAEIWGGCTPGPCPIQAVPESNTMSGYWNAIPTIDLGYHILFPQGVYTVVAGDEWGQVAILHFIVAG